MAHVSRGKPRVNAVVPSVYIEPSEAQLAIFFRHLEEDFEPSIAEAGKKAGITKKQYETLLEKDKGFAARMQEWADAQLSKIEDVAMNLALRGDASMVRFVLQSKRPDAYGSKSKLDVSHSITRMEDLKNLSDEEFAKLVAEADGGG